MYNQARIDMNQMKPDRSIIENDNQLTAAHMSISAINPFSNQISAARNMMNSNQLQSKITLLEPDRKIISCGFSTDMGKYILDIHAPCDLIVTKIIQKGTGTTMSTTIMYEEALTNRLGIIEVPSFRTYKVIYGFKYNATAAMRGLHVGSKLAEGTILASTPSAKNHGYDYGVNLNLALMSMEETAEDGIVLNEDCLDRLSYFTYTTITFPVKSNMVLLDIFGDDASDAYRCIPNVGDRVREDGIVAVSRTMRGIRGDEDDISSVFMIPALGSKESLRTINYHTDKKYQIKGAEGQSEATVVAVNIIRGYGKGRSKRDSGAVDYEGWTDQLDRVAGTDNKHRLDVYEEYKSHCNKYGCAIDEANITEELQDHITRTLALDIHFNRSGKVPTFRNADHSRDAHLQSVKLIAKKEKLPAYTIEIVVRKKCTPYLGGKLTDLPSAKGVIVSILPSERMPRDENGRVADVCCSIEATTNRSIVGRNSDQYISDAMLTLTDKLRKEFNYPIDEIKTMSERSKLRLHRGLGMGDQSKVEWALDELHDLYEIINDQHSKNLTMLRSMPGERDEVINHLAVALELGASIPVPIEVISKLGVVDIRRVRDEGMAYFGNKGSVGIINTIENSRFRPVHGRITYQDRNGNMVTPSAKCRVAPIYYILLDKTGDDYSVSNTTYLQAHNFSATIPNVDRQFHAVNANTVRSLGPDETTIVCGLMDKEHVAELYDRNNSPSAMRNLVETIYSNENPASIYNLVDRKKVPYGHTAGAEIAKHVLGAYGLELIYSPSSATPPVTPRNTNKGK